MTHAAPVTRPTTWDRATSAGLFLSAVLWVQGAYYFLTGVWPLISIRTFLLVTGPKTDNAPSGLLIDHWLVMTVSVLVTAIGLALLVAAWRRSYSAEIAVVAMAAAVGLIAIDVTYVTRRIIEPIYLVDAAIQVVLVVGWIVALARRSRPSRA